MCEEMLRVYLDHLTVLRVRMPISDDLLARNFVTKITRYENCCYWVNQPPRNRPDHSWRGRRAVARC